MESRLEASNRYRITQEEDGYWINILARRSYPVPCQSFGPFEFYNGALDFVSQWEHTRSLRNQMPAADEGGITINVN